MTRPLPQRMVAIVGRPNVGKSAIFNRLSGRRIAIVHSESGVTRDRLINEVVWEDERFELVDTGGIGNLDRAASRDVIEAGIRRQVDAALQDAGVAILVVDIEQGIAPMDEAVARLLHASGCRTVVAVNKADNPQRDGGAAEFTKLGFPVYPVSAIQDRGFGALMEPVLKALPEAANETLGDPLRVAIVGRPNVGKSSYINRLLRSDRVIVSDLPGTTRDSIDIPFAVGSGTQARRYLLIDTAGMRRVGKIKNSVERFSHFRAEKSIARAQVAVLVIDASVGPTAQDKKVATMIAEHQTGAVVLVNKWDLSTITQRRFGPDLLKVMPFMRHCPVVYASAETGYNVRQTVAAIDLVASQVRLKLPTGILNRAILDAYERVNPPAVKGRRLKLFYSTQTGCEPIRISIFVNNAALVQKAYRDYLVNRLRAKFGLEGAPIELRFRSRTRPRD